MASKRSRPTRRACWRKSGVLSIAGQQNRRAQAIIARVLRRADTTMARKRRHSHGGARPQHGKFYGRGSHDQRSYVTTREPERCTTEFLRARLCFGLRSLCLRLRRDRLADLKECHFQFADEVEEHALLIR